MTDYTVALATPLELATEHVHDAMYEAWNDPNPPREEAETEAARKVLTAALDALAIDNPFAEHYPVPDGALDARLGMKNGCKCGGSLIGGRAHHMVAVLRTALLGATS